MKPLHQGIELFNRGEYFEAHEALEDAWREAPAEEKQFLQGLVQAAVGMHHFSKGNLVGARGVLARSIRNLEQSVEHGSVWHGSMWHGSPTRAHESDTHATPVKVAPLLASLRLWLSSTDGSEPPLTPPMMEVSQR